MPEPRNAAEEIGLAQDLVAWRRYTTAEMVRHAEELRELRDALPPKQPWWAPIALGVIIALLTGWLALMQAEQSGMRADIRVIKETQDRRAGIPEAVRDLNQRVLANENAVQRIPYMERALNEIGAKLDKLYQGLYERR